MIDDLRHALRTLRLSPALTAVVVSILALGIGANTAIFSLLYPILLAPLPFLAPEQLVSIEAAGASRGRVSLDELVAWQASDSFVQMSGFQDGSAVLTGGEEPNETRHLAVSGGFCSLLGIRPALGSCFDAAMHSEVDPHQALLSHALWRRYFAAQPDVLGRTVHLDGVAYSVAGVLRSDWTSPLDERELLVPAGGRDEILITRLDPTGSGGTARRDRSERFLRVVGRLRPGVSVAVAQAGLDGISSQLTPNDSSSTGKRGVAVQPLHARLTAGRRSVSGYLAASVVLVLLIACANVGGLLFAHALGRQKELALRLGLGATRGAVVRQLLCEGLLLAAAGGLAGLCLEPLAAWVVNSIATDPTQAVYRRSLDGVVLLFTLVVSCGVALLCSLLPALAVASVDIAGALQSSDSRYSTGIGSRRTGRALVTVEVALATALLVGAGLSLRSLWKIASVPLGLRAENVSTVRFRIPGASVQNADQQLRLCQTAVQKVRAIPGVVAAGLGSMLPLSGTTGRAAGFRKEDGSPLDPPGGLSVDMVGSEYDAALGLRLLRGRWFTDDDIERNSAVVIVNESLAKGHLGGLDVVGHAILGMAKQLEIVGVIADVRHGGPTRPVSPRLYLPLSRARGLVWTHLVTRTSAPAPAVNDAVRREIRRVFPNAAISRPRTMAQRLVADTADRRLTAVLLSGLGATALALAAVGLYGTLTQLVARRVREMAVRMTLGAQATDVLTLVLREGLTSTAVGLALGLAVSLGLVGLLRSQLFGIAAHDPLTLCGALLVMAASAALAAYLPARRATQVDPMVALRCE